LAKEATLKNYTINDEFLIARQLLCSSGKNKGLSDTQWFIRYTLNVV
jgi:hypothetical protein